MPSNCKTVLWRRRRSKVHSSLIFVLFVLHSVISSFPGNWVPGSKKLNNNNNNLSVLCCKNVRTCRREVAVMVTASERWEVRGLSRVVALAMAALGWHTGAAAAPGALITVTSGHNQLDVDDMPFVTLTLILPVTQRAVCLNASVPRIVIEITQKKLKKVKFSHTRYRELGPELIPVYRQSARRWREVNHAINLAVGCRYFLPGLRLPP